MKKTIKSLAEEKGLNPNVVYNRTGKGWTLERALNTPVSKRIETRKYDHEMAAMAVLNGIPERVFKRRVEQGWDAKKASEVPYFTRKKKRKTKKSADKPVVQKREPLVVEGKTNDGIIASAMIIAIVVTIIVALMMEAA
jgi:hypothetical protein